MLVKIYFLLKKLFDITFGFFLTKKLIQGKTDKPKAFLIGTPEHDNLGDHAIALAEYQFLTKYFPELEIVEITVESWRKYKTSLKKYVTNRDIFFMTGGGNMGDIYLADEELRRFIISRYPNNKIIIFPQTIYFSKTLKGDKELNKTKTIYNQHKNLMICAREKMSYEYMQQVFSCKLYLCPDIVFGLKLDVIPSKSKGVVGVCLRNDCENNLKVNESRDLISRLTMVMKLNILIPVYRMGLRRKIGSKNY